VAATNARQTHWVRTAGVVGVAVICALFVAMLATNWVIVDVRDFDHDRAHVVVPVPLNFLRIPLHMMPRASVRIPLHLDRELDRSRCLATVSSLRDAAEGTEVEIEGSEGHATVSRRGDSLVIAVRDGDNDVRVTLPFEATLALLQQIADDRFEPSRALDLLAGAERGDLVAVDARDARIRIRRW
jgi:hypothetical protein